MKVFSSRRRIATAAVVILLALFLLRPGASRLKARITNSISRAVARPADIGSVHVRFLPQPGFDLENLVIYEDPAFGAEPMLRAPEVIAVVRLSSLLWGRLDISRLELTEPSLNLVRRDDGRWNWESLLERTAQTPLAPTAKAKSEARPGFPYIEASSGRINFKTGAEKKPYALLNADFAVWQESENEWGVRLKAQPLRTDMSLSDTGLLRMSGTWQRAGSLRETPLQFSLEWDRAQLGQITKLVTGNDKGWRGDVKFNATLSGTPAAMQVAADASIQNFHRYDISTVEGLGLAAQCNGKYSSAEGVMREIFCNVPVGEGSVTLHGDAGRPGTQRLDLSLNVENVPVSSVTQLARRAKKDLPADLVATGNVQGNFSVKEEGASANGPEFRGSGEIAGLHLQSAGARIELASASVPFVLGARSKAYVSQKKKADGLREAEGLPVADELNLSFGPFPLALGTPVPAQARAWVGRSGYGIAIRGDAEISRALRMAGLLGLPAIKANIEGTALMDLGMAGTWVRNVAESSSGFALPRVMGTVQLRDVRATVRGVNGPIEIASAELRLLPGEARVEKLNARAAEARWTGSVVLPRGCGMPGACLVGFNLNADQITMSAVYEWLGPHPKERRWYQVLTPPDPGMPLFLDNLRASGTVNAGRVLIHGVAATRVSAALDLERGKLKISTLRADLLGGKHRGDWEADMTMTPPVYTGSGTLSAISLEQIAGAMHDPWIAGKALGSYKLTASGARAAAFWQSAEGELRFDLRDAFLTHIALSSGDGPLQIGRWQGSARLHAGQIEIAKSEVDSAAGKFELGGTASLSRILDFKLASSTRVNAGGAGALVYTIRGTVAEPSVVLTPVAETQAQLKPQ